MAAVGAPTDKYGNPIDELQLGEDDVGESSSRFKAKLSGPISSGKFKPEGLGVALGRVPGPMGTIVSARLNPDLAAVANATIEATRIDKSAKAQGFTPENIFAMSKEARAQRAGKRQKGGEISDLMTLYGFLELESVQQTALWLKAVVHMAAFNGQAALVAGWGSTVEQRQALKDYFIENYAPLYRTGARFTEIILRLAEQIFVTTPVTLAMFTTASAAFTANFFRWVFVKFNQLGRAGAEALLSDERARSAADNAVESTKAAVQTAGFMALIANQLGLLPASAVLAAILWQLQASVNTGAGRAYLIASLYAWYSAQPQERRGEINAAAQEYARQAQAAVVARGGRAQEAARAAVGAAAGRLAGVLAQAPEAGAYAAEVGRMGIRVAIAAPRNAYEAVAGAIAGNGGQAPAQVEPAAAAQIAQAAPAAGVAVEQLPAIGAVEALQQGAAPAEAAGPDAAQQGRPRRGRAGGGSEGGRRGKKTRRTPKRRITRRARKYLAAPVFAY